MVSSVNLMRKDRRDQKIREDLAALPFGELDWLYPHDQLEKKMDNHSCKLKSEASFQIKEKGREKGTVR